MGVIRIIPMPDRCVGVGQSHLLPMLLRKLLNSLLKQPPPHCRHRLWIGMSPAYRHRAICDRAIAALLLSTAIMAPVLNQAIATAQPVPPVLPPSVVNSLSRDLSAPNGNNFFQQGQQQMEQEIQRLLQSRNQPEPALLRIPTQTLQIRELSNPPTDITPVPSPNAPTTPQP